MSITAAVLIATTLLLLIIVLVKMFDSEIRKSKTKERIIIFMFVACVVLYIYAFTEMIRRF